MPGAARREGSVVTGSDAAFSGYMPDLYERLLVPMLFAPYAEDMAARATAIGPQRILEIAAGTGAVTRELAAALPQAEIEATDLNPEMVSRGSQLGSGPKIRWSTADAAVLPFADARFDLVMCQFGVMFFPDRVGAFREARRVLDAGGRFLFSVWDGLENNDIPRIVSNAAAAVFPNDPPRFLSRTPYGHGDPVALERELRTAGFNSVTWEMLERRSVAPSALLAARGLSEATPLRHEILERDSTLLGSVVEKAQREIAAEFGDGSIDAPMRAFVFTAQ